MMYVETLLATILLMLVEVASFTELLWMPLMVSMWLYVGFMVTLFILPLIPGAIDLLVNIPNRYDPQKNSQPNPTQDQSSTLTDRVTDLYPRSTFGFFTQLSPGQAKWIEQGGRAVRAIMRHPGHTFYGETRTGRKDKKGRNPRYREYWKVVETPAGERDSHPIPPPWKKWWGWRKLRWLLYSPYSLTWWMWKRWVHTITGAIFTGLYPFRKVRTYRMERGVKVPDAKKGSLTVINKVDWSDQYRVADFQFPVLIDRVLTSTRMPMRIFVNVVARVFNLHDVVFNSDDLWSARLLAAVRSAVNRFVQGKDLDGSLKDPEGLLKSVWKIGSESDIERLRDPSLEPTEGAALRFGIVLPEVPTLIGYEASESQDATDLAAPERARSQRDALKLLGEGQADQVKKTGEALQLHPDARLVIQTEGMVRAAEAAGKGGGTVIVAPGNSGDQTQFLILQALEKLNKTLTK